jgi:iron complex outermembrane recepter protein
VLAYRGNTDYRGFANYLDYNSLPSLLGQSRPDDWHVLRGGFRVDHTFSPRDTGTIQGDIYSGSEGVTTNFGPSPFAPNLANTLNVDLSGGFLQGTWTHAFSNRTDTLFQVSYDAYKREDTLDEGRKTFDVNFQHHFLWGGRQDIVWGFEDRYSESRTSGKFFVTDNPADIDRNLFSVFIQDEIAVAPDRLYLTLGTKVEHNYYTGWNCDAERALGMDADSAPNGLGRSFACPTNT